MHVVATAGHVDHGKSTLVHALTGMAPDRLDEERRRGLSIELGYCWASLPGAGDVAFVDVPGHERFVATMLSGIGPVPVVMFVVAADDPWMPQAAEHLAALDALGTEHGVLVVTRSDLADPEPQLDRAHQELSHTSLCGISSVAVSGRTGEGIDDLRRLLTEALVGAPGPDPASDVRLWVDRRFHVRGAGTVVTGTLPAGTVAAGDMLEVGGEAVRVRGVESLGSPVPSASGVARVALDLAGRTPAQLTRGSALVTPGAFAPADVLDVRVRGQGTPPERPMLHIGSAAFEVHARPLSQAMVRLTLPERLPLRYGDRGLLRDPGSRAVWGVEVLDVAPPPLRRRGAAKALSDRLEDADGTLASEVRRRGVVRRSLLHRIGAAAGPAPEGAVSAADWVVSAERAVELRHELAEAVRKATTPLEPGLTLAAAARALGLEEPELVRALVVSPLRMDGGRVTTADDGLPAALFAAVEALADDLREAPFVAPDASRLVALGLDTAAVGALARGGHVLRIGDTVLLPGADELAVEALRELAQPFTTSEARRRLGTSRRVVLPLLAHLDRTGRTVRLPDDRRRLRADG